MLKHSSTHYSDVNDILDHLLTRAKEALGDQFVGMYLYGSLSSGDFNPSSSDIDFLIVTKAILDEKIIDALAGLYPFEH
jgi:predicted nucleotidyltransferase